MKFVPAVGTMLIVSLPGESMRACVTRVVDPDLVLVAIGQPLVRSHYFRNGDIVACRRTPGVLGESWVAMEMRPITLPDIPEKRPRKRKPKADAHASV